MPDRTGAILVDYDSRPHDHSVIPVTDWYSFVDGYVQNQPRFEAAFQEPEIVCLCGSTRFKEEFERAAREETLAGRIVLSVGLFGHLEGLDMTSDTKVRLDELHKAKIRQGRAILVVSRDGYVGESTTSEIDYAYNLGRQVRWMEDTAQINYHRKKDGKE